MKVISNWLTANTRCIFIQYHRFWKYILVQNQLDNPPPKKKTNTNSNIKHNDTIFTLCQAAERREARWETKYSCPFLAHYLDPYLTLIPVRDRNQCRHFFQLQINTGLQACLPLSFMTKYLLMHYSNVFLNRIAF